MSIQNYFQKFHREIKVETEELREKRDILFDKIRASLKKAGRPLPNILNQGSYIYGVGVKPIGDVEYDIDVGLDFPIKSTEYAASVVRKWVYDAVKDHTDNVEDRGPCIRVRYAAGYHVDLVIYARYKNSETVENYQLARKDDSWSSTDPKKLKKFIADAREPFSETKDSSGSDQLQRVTRFLKRWNDVDTPDESPDKPFGLATLLLVIENLKKPEFNSSRESDDLAALIVVMTAVDRTLGSISIKKPTPGFEDVFAKISAKGMVNLKSRCKDLLAALSASQASSGEKAAKILRKEFGDDFPESTRNFESENVEKRKVQVEDMKAAIPSFSNPSRPWCKS